MAIPLNDSVQLDLKVAIEAQFGGTATFIETAHVIETWRGNAVWNGTVHVFELAGHPTAKRAYAWSEPVGNGDKRQFFAVLHVAPVDSPLAAVKASIVHRQKQKSGR